MPSWRRDFSARVEHASGRIIRRRLLQTRRYDTSWSQRVTLHGPVGGVVRRLVGGIGQTLEWCARRSRASSSVSWSAGDIAARIARADPTRVGSAVRRSARFAATSTVPAGPAAAGNAAGRDRLEVYPRVLVPGRGHAGAAVLAHAALGIEPARTSFDWP